MKTSPFLHYLCALLLLAEFAEAQLLPKPRLASKFQLPNLTLRRGNALIEYLDSLVATTAEGSLVRIDPSDETIIFTFTPDSVADRELSSSSGITVLRRDFAIYSVVDAVADDTETSSRVLCVNLEDGTLVWTASVAGRVVGTPQFSGDLLYVVHNTDVGEITVFQIADGKDPATIGNFSAEDTTLGPASLVTVDKRDVLAVASNRDNGFSAEGGLYMLIEQELQNSGENGGRQGGGGGGRQKQSNQSVGFKFVQVSSFIRSSVTAPLLNRNMELVVGQQGASLAAWAGDDDLTDVLAENFKDDLSPLWQRFVDENLDDENAPILSTPIFSETGELVYVASAGPQFSAVILQDGQSSWSVNTELPITASPVLGENVVYTIESNGRVSQYDAIEGDVKWVMDCDVADTCDTKVEADFVLSDSGNILYFSDTTGSIVSVTVGGNYTEAPTSSPNLRLSEIPTTSPIEETETVTPEPTLSLQSQSPFTTESPTEDTRSNIPGELNQQNPNNDDPKTTGYLVAAVSCVAAFIIAFAACFVCRRNAMSKKDLNSELKAQQLAYEQACRNAEKEALEEIMKDRRNEELMEQSNTDTFYYTDQTMATPASIADTYQHNKHGRDSDHDSQAELGFEVGVGEKDISPAIGRPAVSPAVGRPAVSPAVGRPAISPENLSSKFSKSQHSNNSPAPAPRAHFAPSADVKDGVEDDEEPGRIVFREKIDDQANETQRPPSPAYSDVMSDDDSLYTTDEPRSMMPRSFPDDPKPVISRPFPDDSKSVISRSFSRDSSYPDDESMKASAFPGISSYFRLSSKKPTSPESAPAPNEGSKTEVTVAKTLAHAGVSVRQAPSKSRAGLFSRRNPAVVNRPSPFKEKEAANNTPPSPFKPEPLRVYQEFKPEHRPVSVSSTQKIASVPSPQATVAVPPPQEDEKASQSTSNDVWNSFLSELAKAEISFFGSSDEVSRPPSPPPPPPPDRADSPPPPPPPSHRNLRVPYADDMQAGVRAGTILSMSEEHDTKQPHSPTREKSKGYFWV